MQLSIKRPAGWCCSLPPVLKKAIGPAGYSSREKVSNRNYERLLFSAHRSFLVGSLNLHQGQSQRAVSRLPVQCFFSRSWEKTKQSNNGLRPCGCSVSAILSKIEPMVSGWLSWEAGLVSQK